MDPPTMRTIMNGGGAGGGARGGAGPDIPPKYCELRQTVYDDDGSRGKVKRQRKGSEGNPIFNFHSKSNLGEGDRSPVRCGTGDDAKLGLGLGLAESMAPQLTNHSRGLVLRK